jgi:hypothetical protein
MRSKRLVGVLCGALTLAFLPGVAAAQCEGGTTVGGMYAPDGTYIPGHCVETNPATRGQMYPSGAQPLAPVVTTSSTTGSASTLTGSQAIIPAEVPTNTRGTSGVGVVTTDTMAPVGVPTNTARQTLAGQSTLPDQLAADGITVPSRMRVIGNTTGLREILPAGMRLDDEGFLNLDSFNPSGVVTTSSGRRILGADVQLDLFNPATATVQGTLGRRLESNGMMDQRVPAFVRTGNVVRITVMEVVPEGQSTGAVTTSVLPTNRTDTASTQLAPGTAMLPPALRSDGTVSEVRGRTVITDGDVSAEMEAGSQPRIDPTMPPGRGGPTYLGEERGGGTIITR